MAEKSEKSKQIAPTKHIPKDAQVIMSIMKDMDISEYEPRVINQLLEFTYRYVTLILEDSKTYANHAKKKSIDLDDVRLALQIQLEQAFTHPPPRELLMEISRARNQVPLPPIKPHCGIRLPQDKYCLSSTNLRIKVPQFTKKGKFSHTPFGNNQSDRGMKLTPKANVSVVKRASGPNTSRTHTVTLPKTRPTSHQKPLPKPKINISQSQAPLAIDDAEEVNPLKRKREMEEQDEMYDIIL